MFLQWHRYVGISLIDLLSGICYEEEWLKGLDAETRLRGLDAEERLQGLDAETVLKWYDVEARLQGFSLEQIEAYLQKMTRADSR